MWVDMLLLADAKVLEGEGPTCQLAQPPFLEAPGEQRAAGGLPRQLRARASAHAAAHSEARTSSSRDVGLQRVTGVVAGICIGG